MASMKSIKIPEGLEMPPISNNWMPKVFDFQSVDMTEKNVGHAHDPLKTREDFLGHAVYTVPVAIILINTMPWADKSKLERAKEFIVCTSLSSDLARGFRLEEYVCLPPGCKATDEVLERVWMRYIAAVFEEYGMETTQGFLTKVLREPMKFVASKIREAGDDCS